MALSLEPDTFLNNSTNFLQRVVGGRWVTFFEVAEAVDCCEETVGNAAAAAVDFAIGLDVAEAAGCGGVTVGTAAAVNFVIGLDVAEAVGCGGITVGSAATGGFVVDCGGETVGNATVDSIGGLDVEDDVDGVMVVVISFGIGSDVVFCF